MPDYLDQFASTQNLLALAHSMGAGMPAPASGMVTPYQSSIPIDDYIPPSLPPSNVVHIQPRQQLQPVTPSPDHANILQQLTNIIRSKESSNNYSAVNKKSTASGAYQYTDSTWNNYGGYPKAALAPPAVQDQRFEQEVASRYAKYGNPYQTIAAHYLPALADSPAKWFTPFKVHGRVVKPVIDYVRYVVHGTPLENGLHEYITQQQNG